MIGQLQATHFKKMTTKERKDAINDLERQIAFIAASDSRAADSKRQELQERIDYLVQLNYEELK